MIVRNRPCCLFVMGLAALGAWSGAAGGAIVQIVADHDNTLFEDPLGSLSNGSGQYLFAGVTAMEARRRGLVRFDIAGSVPAGSTISSVMLRMYMSRGGTSLVPVSLHRSSAEWGEGASDADLEEGTGAPAAPGDATWLHRQFGTTLWTAPGGDFDPVPSSTTNVGGVGFWSWASTPVLVADVQQMLDQPGLNFGWLVLRDEIDVPPTAKRFDSRENPVAANRPTLIVEYTIPSPTGGAVLAMGAVLGMCRRRRATPTHQ